MKRILVLSLTILVTFTAALSAFGQDFKRWEAKTAEQKRWLDSQGPKGSGLWMRLDGAHRPHRLYLGDGFFRSDLKTQERFVEIYSTFLAGHPEKYMLIDLFNAKTNQAVGEFGWGGFKLYAAGLQIAERLQGAAE